MDTQQLVEWGKQMNLEGEKLCEFVRAQQAVDRDERIRIRQRKRGKLRLNMKKGLLRKLRKRG